MLKLFFYSFTLLIALNVQANSTLKEKKLTLKKLRVSKQQESIMDPAQMAKGQGLIEQGMSKLDQKVKADGFSVSPNDELLKSLYDNKGDVLKSLNAVDFTSPPINAEYQLSF